MLPALGSQTIHYIHIRKTGRTVENINPVYWKSSLVIAPSSDDNLRTDTLTCVSAANIVVSLTGWIRFPGRITRGPWSWFGMRKRGFRIHCTHRQGTGHSVYHYRYVTLDGKPAVCLPSGTLQPCITLYYQI